MEADDRPDQGRTLLHGAWLAGLSRLGAVIEIATQSLFIWLVGLPAFGLYASLWAGVILLSTVVDFAMTSALQRLVPQLDQAEAHAVVKLAILVTVGAALAVALGVSASAGFVATQFSASPDQKDHLPALVCLFAWALPMWMFVEIATASLRARRAFGPEIRIRVFWEQIARMAFAGLFYLGGVGTYALVAAHLASLALSCAMCVRLLGRYYERPLLLRSPIDRILVSRLLITGASLFPSNLARRLLIHGPAVALNWLLPGSRGAAAAGLFEVARRISTVPYFVRQSFEYVLAPLSAGSAPAEVGRLHALASRMTAALVLPLSAFLVFAARDLLSIYRPEVIAALPVLVILVIGRACDALAGPAQTVIEMTGHRALPVINNVIGLTVCVLLIVLLVPSEGAMGMAWAVASATVLTAWAALIELRILSATGRAGRLWPCLAVTAVSCMIMVAIEQALGGPMRFAALLIVWAAATWANLRWGLEAQDKLSLGGVADRLRLYS